MLIVVTFVAVFGVDRIESKSVKLGTVPMFTSLFPLKLQSAVGGLLRS